MKSCAIWLTSFCALAGCSVNVAIAQPADLEKKARVLLDTHCFKCHSHQSGKDKGGLMLDQRALMLQGGDNGPAIVPGDPAKSLLIKSIMHADPDLKMPRSAPKLAADDIALLTAWVKGGAPWVDAPIKLAIRKPGKITKEDRRYWAFQPINASE